MSWPLVKLSEIFEIARGGSPRPISDYITENSDGLNWISIKDASNSGKYISKTKLKIRKEGLVKSRLVKPGDFLLTNSMSFGRPYIMNTTGCIHDGWLVLSSDKERIDQEYFYYLLGSDLLKAKFTRLAAGAVVKNLNINLVKGVEVPLPPLAEQQKVSEILDTADSLRQKNQQLIEHYTVLSQSLFLEMFGDPVTNSMGWDKVQLDSLGEISTGSTPPSSKINMFNGSIPFVTPSDLDSNKPYKRSVTREGALNSRTINAGALFVCCIGATIGKIRLAKEKCAFNQQINTVQWNSKIHPLFGFYAFGFLKHEVIGRAISTTLPIIKKSKFSKVKCITPPISLQNKFAKRIEVIEKQKQQAQVSLEKSEALFNSLLQRAFKGELTGSKAA